MKPICLKTCVPCSQRNYFRSFLKSRKHNDNVDVLLPNHSPKVVYGIGNRSLSGNVNVFLLVALQEKRSEKRQIQVFTDVDVIPVDIVGTGRRRVQMNATVVVWDTRKTSFRVENA